MEYNLQKFIFDNYTPKVLDFELVRLTSYLLDIGRIIMCYCYENDSIYYYKMINFINGYNADRHNGGCYYKKFQNTHHDLLLLIYHII